MNWQSVLEAFWPHLPATIGAFGALLIGWRNTRKIEVIHKATNSLAAAAAEAARQEGVATGKLDGVQQERAESRDRAAQQPGPPPTHPGFPT
jgi:hypothetical protein